MDSFVEVSHVKHARRIGVPAWVLRDLLEHDAWTISRHDKDTLYLDAAIDLPTRAEVEDRARDRLRALLQEALAVAEAMEREVGVVIVALREALHDDADPVELVRDDLRTLILDRRARTDRVDRIRQDWAFTTQRAESLHRWLLDVDQARQPVPASGSARTPQRPRPWAAIHLPLEMRRHRAQPPNV